MDIINIISFEKENFLKELKLKTFNKKCLYFNLNSQLGKNTQFFFEFILNNKENISKINFIKYENIDYICFYNFQNYIQKNFSELIKNIKFEFIDFKKEEIKNLISLEKDSIKYSIYNIKNNKEVNIFEKKFETVIEEKNNEFQYLFEFDICLNFYKKNKNSSRIEFTNEKNKRFLFYFLKYKNENKLKNLLEKLNFSDDLIKIMLKTSEIYFCISFLYKKNKLFRKSFYIFLITINENKEKNFLEEITKIKLNSIYKNKRIDLIGFDYFENKKLTKIYLENRFEEEIDNFKINKLLNKQLGSICLKFENGKIVEKKYEFFQSSFNQKQKIFLKEKLNVDLFKYKIFTIYLENKTIKIIKQYNH